MTDDLWMPGDVIQHLPANETWVVAAADPACRRVMWCGWPEGEALIADCVLLRRADLDYSIDLHSRLTGTRRAMADRVYGTVDQRRAAMQAAGHHR